MIDREKHRNLTGDNKDEDGNDCCFAFISLFIFFLVLLNIGEFILLVRISDRI